jgi:hypothetical protein
MHERTRPACIVNLDGTVDPIRPVCPVLVTHTLRSAWPVGLAWLHPLDERGLCLGVLLDVVEHGRQPALLDLVGLAGGGITPEQIAEGDVPTRPGPARLADVNVVRPPVKELVVGIVGMVLIAEREERRAVSAELLQSRYLQLDVDPGLGSEPRHGRRADMLDADGGRAQRPNQSGALGRELPRPSWIVWNNPDQAARVSDRSESSGLGTS